MKQYIIVSSHLIVTYYRWLFLKGKGIIENVFVFVIDKNPSLRMSSSELIRLMGGYMVALALRYVGVVIICLQRYTEALLVSLLIVIIVWSADFCY